MLYIYSYIYIYAIRLALENRQLVHSKKEALLKGDQMSSKRKYHMPARSTCPKQGLYRKPDNGCLPVIIYSVVFVVLPKTTLKENNVHDNGGLHRQPFSASL
jgi:hypothetical protein